MDVDNQVHHDDPQFVKVLETCLKMEITAAKETIEGKWNVRFSTLLMKSIIQNEGNKISISERKQYSSICERVSS